MKHFMKIRLMGAESFHEDGQTGGQTDGHTDRETDMTKHVDAFHNCVKALKRT
jgi:hypothetical protein